MGCFSLFGRTEYKFSITGATINSGTVNMPRPGQPEATPACICRCDTAESPKESGRSSAAPCDPRDHLRKNFDLSLTARPAARRGGL